MRRRLTLSGVLIAVVTAWYLSVQPQAGTSALPDQLSGKAFWELSTSLSEPNGYFRFENLLSNEIWMQHVIPELRRITKPGRVYLGVGPEQNFTYIAATRPAMAFIVDVRRGNLQLHLMYKALFEMSADRAEFVSRLFSKKRPASLTPKSAAAEIFEAYSQVPTSEALYNENLKAIREHLIKTRGIPLDTEDLQGIEYVAYQFYWFGPGIHYNSNNPRTGRYAPTYYDLMVADDGAGQNRGYLAAEDHFLFVKSLHQKNLIVPVVGDFGGPKALRAVGRYLEEKGGTVAAFYLSNVEQYLDQQSLWPAFCRNVRQLPLDDQSTFIRSERSRGGFGGYGFSGLMSQLGNMKAETAACPK